MLDTFRHKGLRRKLVEELVRKGIKDSAVLAAIEKIPRHFFLAPGLDDLAYKDQACPIGAGQTISQPYTVAFQTQLLQLSRNQKVLEVGTGSGYQTSVLLEMGVKIYSIERQRTLFFETQRLLSQMGYQPSLHFGDGYIGLPTYGPFDRILVTAGADLVPPALVDQLKIGGRLVIPVGGRDLQHMLLVVKELDGTVNTSEHGNFAFVPLLKGTAS